jgi:hypothetical protein
MEPGSIAAVEHFWPRGDQGLVPGVTVRVMAHGKLHHHDCFANIPRDLLA